MSAAEIRAHRRSCRTCTSTRDCPALDAAQHVLGSLFDAADLPDPAREKASS